MILSIIKQDQNSGHPLAIEIMYELYDHCMPECPNGAKNCIKEWMKVEKEMS